MDRYTFETRCWLDLRFDPEVHEAMGAEYQPYQPVHGISEGSWGANEFLMAARYIRLFCHLRSMGAQSFLDVGGAEGFVAWMVGDAFGVPTVSVDLSVQAGLRAGEFFGTASAAVDAARLPFADNAFDVVFLSEVLEHLALPLRTLSEVQRVARRAVILTTEAYARSEEERSSELAERRLSPHMDRSIFCPEDFEVVFGGWNLLLHNQASVIPDPVPDDINDVKKMLVDSMQGHDLAWPSHGIVVVGCREGQPVFSTEHVEESAARVFGYLAPRQRPMVAPGNRGIPGVLMERVQCPVTGGALKESDGELRTMCGRSYRVFDGVPDLAPPRDEPFGCDLEDAYRNLGREDGDNLARLSRLDEQLRFELPDPLAGPDLLADGASAWELGEGVESGDDPGVLSIVANNPDPMLFSPRLDRPFSSVGGFVIEICAENAVRDVEQVQIYCWSLKRPVWVEQWSATRDYPTDGGWHRLEISLPDGWGHAEDDQLLQIRVDPCHGSGRIRFREIGILSPQGDVA